MKQKYLWLVAELLYCAGKIDMGKIDIVIRFEGEK